MSMGKAVVATRVDGTREVVQDEANGLLVEPGDLQALAAALVRLGRDGSLRVSLRQHALDTIREQYNAVTMTRRIEAVYDSFVR
jgi:glycosyltransferase involved in cell wall biosynthesis